MDIAKHKYRKKRMVHWDRVSKLLDNPKRAGAFYHKLIDQYYKFLIPKGLRVLELGCAHGDLLAGLNPSFGVGVDFSEKMIRRASTKYSHLKFIRADALEVLFKEEFDVIVLSDLVNDLWDVQSVLVKLRPVMHSRTRIILNFFNNLWHVPLSLIRRLGLGAEVLEQNWLSPQDIFNLLELSGFEVIKHDSHILLPFEVPLFSKLANRFLVNCRPFSWFALTHFVIARLVPDKKPAEAQRSPSVSIIVPARNEAGNIESILKRIPSLGKGTEIIFVEGHSKDDTYETVKRLIDQFPEKNCRLFRQSGKGKGDAVRMGFGMAKGEILMILDADMTVPPEDLTRFYEAIVSGKGEFINGVRLVYPIEDQAMRFFNTVGNKFFSLAFSYLLGQAIKDTLCGTKVLWKRDYESIAKNRDYFGDFDPFGDFDLLFGAAKLNFKIVEVPIRYRSRAYGDTNIDRWRHGWLLIKMVFLAAKRIKFI